MVLQLEEPQDGLVEHLLLTLVVDLVEDLKDQHGELLTEVVMVEHMEIQDLNGELIPDHNLIQEVEEEELTVVDQIAPLILMVEMEKVCLGYYLDRMANLDTSLLVEEAVVW